LGRALEITVPRDPQGTFQAVLVRKRQQRFRGLDTKIVALYARGLSAREIQAHLEELYGVEVSPGLVSKVTDAVVNEIKASCLAGMGVRQPGGLERLSPIAYLDCWQLKIRSDGTIETKAVWVGMGVNLEAHKDLLGL